MFDFKEKFALQSLRTKIILTFLFGCIVVLFSWLVAKVVFRETFLTIEKIRQPNPKLRIVNSLLIKIHNLDQVQRLNILRNGDKAQSQLISESEDIIHSLDTLQRLYNGDSLQVARLDHMKDLLLQRDKLFLQYLKFHEELVHNRSLTSNMRELSDYINESMRRRDSNVVTTRQKTTTTTLDLPGEEPVAVKQESFFKRLFSRKKQDQKAKRNRQKQVTEDVVTTTDTQAVAQRNNFIKEMETVIGTIEKDQSSKSAKLINHEAMLANASNTFINELQLVLYQVQEEEIRYLQDNTLRLSDVFNGAFNRVGLILLIFLALTILLIFLMFVDLSQTNRNRLELIEAKEKAQHMEKVKERFLANMSHEIRTPLQSIIGYAEQLKVLGSTDHEHAEAIYRSSEYLLQIVNEILDYSRLTSGKFRFESSGFRMEEVLGEIADTMESQAEAKGIHFRFRSEIPDGILHRGDSFRLKQILYNLLNNAIKFTERGEVSFLVSSAGDARKTQFVFEIKDTGIGMDEEQLKYIFNAFEQASESTQRNFGGTGLGLSITKTLVEMQRGTLTVSSHKGQGTSFTVSLGYLKTTEAENGHEPIAEPEAPGSGFQGKVLIVDDDVLILKLCELILNKHGISYRSYHSAEEALHAEWDPEVKLALIDIRMPGTSGTELCNALKQKAPEGTGFVALTAEVLPDEIERILSQGFDRILLKPFREKGLLQILEQQVQAKDDVTNAMTAFDLSSLRVMCDNREELQSILELMLSETKKDLKQLKELASARNHTALRELFHKLAARTGQAGATALSMEFRTWEQRLQKEDAIPAQALWQLSDLLEAFTRNLEQTLLQKH